MNEFEVRIAREKIAFKKQKEIYEMKKLYLKFLALDVDIIEEDLKAIDRRLKALSDESVK